METEEQVTENGALLAAVKQLFGAEIKTVEFEDGDNVAQATFAILPEGKTVESIMPLLDEFRTQPARTKGVATIADLESFLAHAKRFAAPEDSVIFADPRRDAPCLTAVYDYSGMTSPRFHGHRAVYRCPLSDAWKAWAARDGKPMSQVDFAAFLEERIADAVLPPKGDEQFDAFVELVGARIATPHQLLELSRGLTVRAEHQVKQAVTLASGEGVVHFAEQHTDEKGQPLRIPNFFLITIPVFHAGDAFRIPVRLRYRLQQGQLTWSYQLYRADLTFDAAFQDVVEKAKASGLPVYAGAPEAG